MHAMRRLESKSPLGKPTPEPILSDLENQISAEALIWGGRTQKTNLREWDILGTAQEIITEIMMLAMIYNNCTGPEYASSRVKEWDTLGFLNLGIRFDVQGKIHIDPTMIKSTFNRNSETFHRLINHLRNTVDAATQKGAI